MNTPRLRSRLVLDSELGTFLGDTRIRLLEAIEQYDSISQAAKAVPLSYKAAWDAVDNMNNLAEQAIVVRSTGGKQGGGTQLTAYGRKLIALYRAMESEYQAAWDRVSSRLNEEGESDLAHFQDLIRRMALKTSARNQFAGAVTALRQGPVDFEVRIQLDEHSEIVAIITEDSARNLELQIGSPIMAVVKSSSVLLMTDPSLKTSARNQLWGQVVRIQKSPVNAEITLMLPGGKSVCAVITLESLEHLELQLGSSVCAAFKASAVILCAYHTV